MICGIDGTDEDGKQTVGNANERDRGHAQMVRYFQHVSCGLEWHIDNYGKEKG